MRSAFFAGKNRTPARVNSSLMLPAPEPMRAKIASSATPVPGIFQRLHIAKISWARIGTVQPMPSFGLSVSFSAGTDRPYGYTAEVARLREGASLPKLFSLVVRQLAAGGTTLFE